MTHTYTYTLEHHTTNISPWCSHWSSSSSIHFYRNVRSINQCTELACAIIHCRKLITIRYIDWKYINVLLKRMCVCVNFASLWSTHCFAYNLSNRPQRSIHLCTYALPLLNYICTEQLLLYLKRIDDALLYLIFSHYRVICAAELCTFLPILCVCMCCCYSQENTLQRNNICPSQQNSIQSIIFKWKYKWNGSDRIELCAKRIDSQR